MYTSLNKTTYPIDCKIWIPKNTEKVLIAIHGFAGDKESGMIHALAEEMLKYNTLTIAFDLPGHGTSKVDGDSLTLNNCLSDIKTVETIYKEQYPNAKIDYFATSFGAYLLLLSLVKEERKIDKIVLRCPAICMDKIFRNKILREPFHDFQTRGYTIVGYERELKVNFSFYKELKQNQIFAFFPKRKYTI